MSEEILSIFSEAGEENLLHKISEKIPNISKDFQMIKNKYESPRGYKNKCLSTGKEFLDLIFSEERLKEIHSARYRVKTTESLLVKYAKKVEMLPQIPGNEPEIEKYRFMNPTNYQRVITDLIGVRILIRYPQQWKIVHDWLWESYHSETNGYISHWIEDYPSGCDEDYIVERPKLYLRNPNEEAFYQKPGDDTFEVRASDEGYTSIHYVLWFDKKYIEVQVRTIYDEAWSECIHNVVYKCKKPERRRLLEELSMCLATQTQSASQLASVIYSNYYDADGMVVVPKENSPKPSKAASHLQGGKDYDIMQRAQLLNKKNEKETSGETGVLGILFP